MSYFLNEKFLRKKIFKNIFLSGYWLDYNLDEKQSRSGKGSNFNQSLLLKNALKIFFKEKKIKKILDIGCGDFNWMSTLLSEVDYESYLGVDLVDTLINDNIKKYGSKKIKFITKDIINDNMDFLESYDFILIRHVFIHLKNSNIKKAINQIKNIDFRYLGVTSDPKILNNFDLKTDGRFRDINLLISPFFLDNSYQVIKESVHGDQYNVDLNIYDSNIKSK